MKYTRLCILILLVHCRNNSTWVMNGNRWLMPNAISFNSFFLIFCSYQEINQLNCMWYKECIEYLYWLHDFDARLPSVGIEDLWWFLESSVPSVFVSLDAHVVIQSIEATVRVLVFKNTTFSNNSAISWRSVLLVEETGVRGENYRSVTSHTVR